MHYFPASCALGLLAAVCPAGRLEAQHGPFVEWPVHSRADINDPRSHGVVGDKWLSLRETILLTNGKLDENSLSAEEVAQLSGFGNDIAWAQIDAIAVPVVTLERNLPIIEDTPHGFTVAGENGKPRIDLGDTRGFVAESDFVDFRNLRLSGGDHGIHITQFATLFGSLIERVEFDGHGTSGLLLTLRQAGGMGRIQIEACEFRGLPAGIVIDDTGDDRTAQIEVFGTRIVDCGIGYEARMGKGGRHILQLVDTEITGAQQAVRLLRTGVPGGRDFIMDGRYVTLRGAQSAFSVQGLGTAMTRLVLRAFDLSSPVQTLDVGPLGAEIDLTVQDSRLDGALRLAGGSGGQLAIENCHVTRGNLSIGTMGAPAGVASGVIDGVAVSTVGTSAVTIDDSRLIGGSVQGAPQAPLLVQRSHLTGTTVGSNASIGQPLADAPLGTFEVTPLEPTVGTNLTVQSDLPAKLSGFCLFAEPLNLPTVLPGGLRVYLDLPRAALVTTPVRNQQQIVLPIPNSPSLVGLELFFHLAVVPDPGATAPSLWLPPGRRIIIR